MKKFFEFFDDEDLKSKFEIPYLKGEMGEEISKNFKSLKLATDRNTRVFTEQVLIEYPILEKFNSKVLNESDEEYVVFFASSYKPIQGITFYAQIGFSYIGDTYIITIILKDLEEDDQNRWEIFDYEVNDMKEVYPIVDSFMKSCVVLNIIKPEDKFSISRN